MSKFKNGDLCCLDYKNELNQDTKGYSLVYVGRKINRGIFSKTKYAVIAVNNKGDFISDPLVVEEKYLTNANKLVVRYPENIPVLNKEDIEALKFVVVMCKEHIPEKTMRRIIALKDKLDYYYDNKIVREELM